MKDLTIILPTKDEEQCIGEVIKRISLLGINSHVLVVDDSDNILTHKAALKSSVENNVDLEYIGGAGNESPSIRKALLHSNSEIIAILDADGSHSIEILPDMLEYIRMEFSLCVGSRYCENGNGGSSNVFSSVGNRFARSMLGLKTKELTSRFFVAKRDSLLKASEWDGRGENSIDVVNYFERRGLKIKEIPFTHANRIGGNSKTNVLKYIRTYLGKVFHLKVDEYRLFTSEYISRALSNDWTGEKKNKKTLLSGLINFFQFPICVFGVLFCRIPIMSNLLEMVSRIWGKGRIGFLLRAIYYKTKLGFMGVNVFIDQNVTMLNPGRIFIDNNSLIDQGVQIICGEGEVRIGEFTHIGSNCYINGKPFVIIGDYACVDHQCIIFGSTNEYERNGRRFSMSCVAPMKMQSIVKIGSHIGDMSFVGPNSVIVAASIGNDTVVGANSFVKFDIESNSIAAGSPARVLRKRSCLME